MPQFSNPLPPLNATGRYLTDPEGNVVVLRGFNLCSKTAQTPEQLGFDQRNADFLKASGVSVVRLGVPWANTQPYLLYDPNGSGAFQYDTQFLDSIKRTIGVLANAGIYTLVDFHQDAYSAPWGFGAPSWALVAGGTNTPSYPWPLNTFGGNTFQLKGEAKEIETDLNSAFNAFWNDSPVLNPTRKSNGQPFTLWELYGAMLQYVSAYLSDQQGNILGYDPINEPEPGSMWTEGYVPTSDPDNLFNFPNGYLNFDRNFLAKFYRQCAIPSLRAGHPEAMIWFEPNIYFDYNAPTSLPDLNAQFGNLGFNFHNYDAASGFRKPIDNALTYQYSYDVPLLCSEFGGTTKIVEIQAVADLNDGHILSAIFWAWFNNAQFNFAPSADGTPTDPRAMGVVQNMAGEFVPPNLNQEMLNALTRIYPRVTAGTPNSLRNSGTPETGHYCKIDYSTRLPNGNTATGVTVLAVPAALYVNGYDGFDVIVPDGVTAVKKPEEGIVEIHTGSSPPSSISLQVVPINAGDRSN